MELWNNRKPRAAVIVTDEVPVIVPASLRRMDGAIPGTAQVAKEGPEAATSPAAVPGRARIKERSFQAKLEWRLDDDDDNEPKPAPELGTDNDMEKTAAGSEIPNGPAGVLKCRCDQRMRMGLLYEGRYKSLLFSLGTDINLKRLDAPFRTVGLAVQFSS